MAPEVPPFSAIFAEMDAINYLSVLLSIIIGLGFTRIRATCPGSK
jgi:hypothetical protein